MVRYVTAMQDHDVVRLELTRDALRWAAEHGAASDSIAARKAVARGDCEDTPCTPLQEIYSGFTERDTSTYLPYERYGEGAALVELRRIARYVGEQ